MRIQPVGVLRALVFVAAGGYVVLYAALVCLRVRYPFELEWLEGAAVDHVRTILAGRPLYARPSLEFVPLTYTPGYFYLAAVLSKAIGIGFLPLRIISIASSFGLLAVMFRLAWRETGDPHAGVLAVGLFAAMFGWTNGWLDLARTDSLFLFLVMLAVYVIRWHDSARAAGVAALIIAASFLVKQTGLIVALPLALLCALRGWRSFVSFTGILAAVVIGTTLSFDSVFDGWYRYYVFSVPKQHPVAIQSILGFWRYDILRPLPFALLGSLVFVATKLRERDRSVGVFYLLVGAGCFAGAWISRLHSLSYVNVVLPAYAALSLVFAIGVYSAIRDRQYAGPASHGFGVRSSSGGPRSSAVALYGVCLAQLAVVWYLPQSFVPDAEDVRAGHALLRRIAESPGRVFVPYHGYLPALAGHETNAHAVVMADVIRGGLTDVERGLARDLEDALKMHRYDVVISLAFPTPVRHWLPIELYYRPDASVVTVKSRFWNQETVWVPR